MSNLLYVGRVAKVKGLDNLVSACAAARMPGGWSLRIVGPDQEEHAAELRKLAARLGVADKIVFAGPKYGKDLDLEYERADLFVLPSYSENFGSVVIEALAHGKPVITTKGTPWEELEERKCGWWIDVGVEPLAGALSEAMAMDDAERREMGERGRRLVAEKYTWDSVVRALAAGYESILDERRK